MEEQEEERKQGEKGDRLTPKQKLIRVGVGFGQLSTQSTLGQRSAEFREIVQFVSGYKENCTALCYRVLALALKKSKELLYCVIFILLFPQSCTHTL